MVDVSKKAYNEVLAPHHNWFIRTTANMAMGLVNSRKDILESITKEQTKVLGRQYTEEEMNEDFKQIYDLTDRIRKYLEKFYTERGLDQMES